MTRRLRPKLSAVQIPLLANIVGEIQGSKQTSNGTNLMEKHGNGCNGKRFPREAVATRAGIHR